MRTVIVSNRLPVTVQTGEAGFTIHKSVGGLATGLAGPHEKSGGVWVGWPGLPTEELAGQEQEVDRALEAQRLRGVPLSRAEVRAYYETYCNGTLWPLLHSFVGQLPLVNRGFRLYDQVNLRFAERVAEVWQPGDLIWVHDYQLMRVPLHLRRLLPEARVGFFLHIPFPSSEAFRTLPHREALLEGLLGADLIGFHTAPYMRHFSGAVLRVLGASTELDHLLWEGRRVELGVFPMGVDAAAFSSLGDDPKVAEQAKSYRGDLDGQLLLGIDRLDYTKGIPRRLLAYEQLLENHPELHAHIRLVQLAVPSRTQVEAYAEFRDQVDGLVGRINGRFGTPQWTPVHYVFRGFAAEEVTALYRAADVLLVTPIRDGMNLVAKEFVAARTDEDGVVVLSEFAGAASELAEAVLVNPYDIDATAEAIYQALTMPAEERRARMVALRRRVLSWDVHRWVDTFLERLDRRGPADAQRLGFTPEPRVHELIQKLAAAPSLLLFLDYDGTLVKFASTPQLARPDRALLELLGKLAGMRATTVHLVSGRIRANLQDWLGELRIGLHGEHGLWSRLPGDDWVQAKVPVGEWREKVRQILDDYAARTPGSLVEEKTVGLAWHYRMAEPEFALHQANDLKLLLRQLLSNAPVEVLEGDKVVEVRPYGINKGRVVAPMLGRASGDVLPLAMGDDRTDEDLFAALPEGGVTIHVGPQPSRATYRLQDVAAARAFLQRLVKLRSQ